MLPKIDPKNFQFQKTDGQHTIAIIPSIALDGIWSELVHELEKQPELWNKAHTIESIYNHICLDLIKLWAIYDKDNQIKMFFFTTLTIYPVISTLTMSWASGKELTKYLSMGLSALEEYAAHHNIGAMVLDGRKGWGPVLANFGYSELQVSFFKPIQPQRMN